MKKIIICLISLCLCSCLGYTDYWKFDPPDFIIGKWKVYDEPIYIEIGPKTFIVNDLNNQTKINYYEMFKQLNCDFYQYHTEGLNFNMTYSIDGISHDITFLEYEYNEGDIVIVGLSDSSYLCHPLP